MLPPDADAPEEIVWQGKFVITKKRGRWEYAGRTGGIRAAVILAIEDGRILLVEQYRVPLGRRCLELPAGLIGDEAGAEEEDVLTTAARELEEETGYRAAHLEEAGEFCASPGMLSESFTLVRASGLEKVGDGGGTESEDISVHMVPLTELAGFVEARREAGCAMDVKLLGLLLAGTLESET